MLGLPKRRQYELYITPRPEDGLLPRSIELPDREGSEPMRVDIDLSHGAVISGRLIDRSTGNGVRGSVTFTPVGDTVEVARKLGYQSWRGARTEADGRFSVPAVPGSGFLSATAYADVARLGGQRMNPYKLASIDPADRSRLKIRKDRSGRVFLQPAGGFFTGLGNACKIVDIPEGTKAVQCDLFVDPGLSLTVKLQDADGKPLAGGTAAEGIVPNQHQLIWLEGHECPVYGLDPEFPRLVMLFHDKRNMAATLTLRGDEKEPVVARLLPAGTIVGRLLDDEGKPVVGVRIKPHYGSGEAQGIDLQISPRRKPVLTDKDGRFRLEGVIPNTSPTLEIWGRKNLNFALGSRRSQWRQARSSTSGTCIQSVRSVSRRRPALGSNNDLRPNMR